MKVLVVGAGVIGTVYGAHLAAAGHAVSVLSHPPRTDDIAARGLAAHDVLTGSRAEAPVRVVGDPAAERYDLVLAAVRGDQLGAACARLAADRPALGLMCTAVTEAFAALRRAGVTGLTRNLAILHSPALRPVAVRYWARTMRSPMGELCFAAHSRHAQAEMRALGDQVTRRIGSDPRTGHVRELLGAERPLARGPRPVAGPTAAGQRRIQHPRARYCRTIRGPP